MKTIEEHIEKDQAILLDPTTSPAARRHIKEELHELEVYHTNIIQKITTIQTHLNYFARCTLMNQSVSFMTTNL